MSLEDWFKILTGTAGAVVCMLMGIKWLINDRDSILKSLQEERNGRLAQLELSAETCSRDRAQMHTEMNELQKEVRELMKQMIDLTAKHKIEIQSCSNFEG